MTADTPARAALPADRPALHEEQLPALGAVRIVELDPAADAGLVHRWVTEPRARYWGMLDADREQVRETYAYVDSLTTHHAFLALRDGRPAALFQSYRPEHDPVGECYEVRPGDHGMHLLIGPPDGPPQHGVSRALVGVFVRFLFADPARRRIVAEPDARNGRAIALLRRCGFEPGPEIEKPEKRARLVFLDRAAAGPA
ncbi:GNAT family N-acetyltransferase [Streptomyces sp. NRRL B-24484]|uniref:GNAT family N-acetyltransferase n=1 Tax=Streptomyces sp. NRRL B-24484 TaxID=1463833 RepID=UPI0005BB0692|nr:GNAT family N-acetyltransferase [Streptomyces sp. NRRL B-24484]